MAELKQTTFIGAVREFFGQNRGEMKQTLQEFAEEVRQLNEKERAEFVDMFRTVGFDATKTSPTTPKE